MNHYRIEPPFYVSFSGGRTIGYMEGLTLPRFTKQPKPNEYR